MSCSLWGINVVLKAIAMIQGVMDQQRVILSSPRAWRPAKQVLARKRSPMPDPAARASPSWRLIAALRPQRACPGVGTVAHAHRAACAAATDETHNNKTPCRRKSVLISRRAMPGAGSVA